MNPAVRSLASLEELINGDLSSNTLNLAIWWAQTPQKEPHWRSIFSGVKEYSPEDMSYLRSLLPKSDPFLVDPKNKEYIT